MPKSEVCFVCHSKNRNSAKEVFETVILSPNTSKKLRVWNNESAFYFQEFEFLLICLTRKFTSNSQCCEKTEKALKRANTGKLIVVFILLEPCDWEGFLKKFSFPKDLNAYHTIPKNNNGEVIAIHGSSSITLADGFSKIAKTFREDFFDRKKEVKTNNLEDYLDFVSETIKQQNNPFKKLKYTKELLSLLKSHKQLTGKEYKITIKTTKKEIAEYRLRILTVRIVIICFIVFLACVGLFLYSFFQKNSSLTNNKNSPLRKHRRPDNPVVLPANQKNNIKIIIKVDTLLFMNELGEYVSHEFYDEGQISLQNRIRIKDSLTNKWGFGTLTGKIAIPCIYDTICHYERIGEKYLARCKYKGKWGVLSLVNDFTVLPQYDMIFPFSEKKAVVQKGGYYGYIDAKGQEIVKPIYQDAFDFVGGVGVVVYQNKWRNMDVLAGHLVEISNSKSTQYRKVHRNNFFGYLNPVGQLIIPTTHEKLERFDQSTLLVGALQNGWWGFYNKSGQLVIDFQYDEIIRSFHANKELIWATVRKNDSIFKINFDNEILVTNP